MKEKTKEMFLSGASIENICACLNISRDIFYRYKNEDFDKGISWEVLVLENNRNEKKIKEKEAYFLNTLIDSFEKFFEKKDELDSKTIEKLNKYALTYWKLKAPRGEDEFLTSQKKKKIIQDVLYQLGDLALSTKNKEVSVFLSSNAEEILNRVLESKNAR